MKRPTALVIGFGPFPGAAFNPSEALVRSLARMRRPAFADTRVVTHVLPTAYRAVEKDLPALLARHDPDLVLMFGLAGRARTLRIETLAANARSLLHPDAERRKHQVRALVPKAPEALKVAAPVAALIAAAKSAGVNANVSRNAGRYICNAALYTCLDLRRGTGRPPLVAFVHIPRPRMPLRRGKRANGRRPAAAMLARAGVAILAALISAMRRR